MKKRRLLSIVLSLCMVLALMPQMAFAEDDTSELQDLLNIGGTVKLEKDYTITSTIEVNNTVNLDLNGHVIKMTSSKISVIKVNSGGNLTLQDSDSDAVHDDTSLPAGGVITGGKIPFGDGGGVYVDGGSFTMAGGTISDCSSRNGGGVYVGGGNFTMTGGAIYDCTSAGYGGGVCVQNNGSFEMTGGAISKCNSGGTGGGGVYVNNGSFTMNGGAITDCSADIGGGGITLAMKSSFTMNGGTISDCRGSKGAAVAYPEATIFANGGSIMNNVELNGARIENTAPYGGTVFYGGISIDNSGTINGKKVTFKKDNEPYAIEIVAEGNKAIEPTIKPDAPEGYKFTGWYKDETLKTPYDFRSSVNVNELILYAGFDPIITITVPFTTKVELGGNMQPDETVFNMQVLDSNGDKYSSGNVKIEAKPVTTNGAGSYDGEITFTGTEAEIFNMFRYNGSVSGSVFVKQEDLEDYSDWEVDDTVWCIFHSGVNELSEGEVEPSPILILPTKCEYNGDVMYYYPVFPEDDEKQPDQMTFTNTYTKSVAAPADSDSNNGSAANTRTGDDSSLALWLALLAVSAAGLIGTGVYSRRRKSSQSE